MADTTTPTAPTLDPSASSGLPPNTNATQIPSGVLEQFIQQLIAQGNLPLQQAQATGQQQIGLQGTQTQNQINQAQQQAGFSQQSLGLQRQEQIDLPQQTLQFQEGQAPQQQALNRDLSITLPTAGVNRQLALQPQLYGLQQQGFGLQQQGLDLQTQALDEQAQQLDYNSMRQLQQAMGDQASRGATSTVGASRQLEDIAKQKGWSQDDLARARSQLGISGSQLGLTEQGAALQNTNTMAGLQDQLTGLKDQSGLMDLSNAAQNFGFGQQEKMFGLIGQGLGLQGQEIGANLQNTIQNLGLSNQISTSGVLSGLAQQALGQIPANLNTINTVAGMSFDKMGLPANITPDQLTQWAISGNLPGQTTPGTTPPAGPTPAAPPAPKAPAPAPSKTGPVKPV
jgi:hypothetical protein